MRTIILCRGLPASGKSTWAKEQLKKYPGKYKRVNRDLLRAMLDDSQFSNKNEVFITEMEKTITLHALAKGLDVIVDDTNLRASNFTEYCKIAKRVGNVRVMEKYFDVDLKTCIARNENREPNIPKEAIQRMYNRYLSKGRKLEIRDDYFPPVIKDFKKDASKKDAVIIDIDGTLAHNYNGRSPYDGSRVNEDVVDEHIKMLAKTFYDKHKEGNL